MAKVRPAGHMRPSNLYLRPANLFSLLQKSLATPDLEGAIYLWFMSVSAIFSDQTIIFK